MNVPHLAAHRKKRAGKEECFGVIKKLAAQEHVRPEDIAALYSYFLPPKPKKITSVFEFLAFTCDDKSPYAFTKYVQSGGGVSCAANTSQASIAFSQVKDVDGMYDTSGGYAGVDVAVMPDVMSAMVSSQSEGTSDGFSLESLTVVETSKGLAYLCPWNSSRCIPKPYLDVVYPSVNNPVVCYGRDGSASVSGYVAGVPVCAIFMTTEYHDLNGGNS